MVGSGAKEREKEWERERMEREREMVARERGRERDMRFDNGNGGMTGESPRDRHRGLKEREIMREINHCLNQCLAARLHQHRPYLMISSGRMSR